jgi:hypothetical protein
MEQITKRSDFLAFSAILGITVVAIQGLYFVLQYQKLKREMAQIKATEGKVTEQEKLNALSVIKTKLEINKLNGELPAQLRITEANNFNY